MSSPMIKSDIENEKNVKNTQIYSEYQVKKHVWTMLITI